MKLKGLKGNHSAETLIVAWFFCCLGWIPMILTEDGRAAISQ